MASDDVTILLGARDQATPVINRLQSTLTKLSSDAGPSLAIGKVFAAMGAVEGATRGIAAASAIWNGELDVAAENIKRLPFGLGSAASALEDMLKIATGHNEKMAELQGLQDAAAAKERERKGILDAQESIQKKLLALQQQAAREAPGTQFEREQVALVQKREQAMKELDDLAQKIAARPGTATYQRLAEARKLLQEQFARDIADAFDKEQENQRRLAETRKSELNAEREKAFSIQQQRLDLDSELKVARLRALGEDEAAEVESIRRRYAARIAEAEKASDNEAKYKLQQLRELDIAEARDRNKKSGGSSKISQLQALESRFLSRAPGVGEVDPTLKPTQDTASNTAKMLVKLDQVSKAIATLRQPFQVGIGL